MSSREDEVQQLIARYRGMVSSGGNVSSDPVQQMIAAYRAGTYQPAATQEEGPGFLEQVGNVGEAILSIPNIFSDQAAARQELIGTGLLTGAVLDPITALLQLPGTMAERQIFTDRAASWLKRFSDGLITEAEQNALDSGLDENDIAAAHGLGEFVGIIAPMGASVKAAGLIMRAPVRSLGKHVFTGPLTTDLVAGAIYGTTFMEGEEIGERVAHGLEQSAMFGVGRLILTGVVAPFAAYRNKRLNAKGVWEEMHARLIDMEAGRTPTLRTEDEARHITSLMTEEGYISASPAAQEIFARSADESALIQALVDVSEGGAGNGILRGVGAGRKARDVEAQYRSLFPNLKFTTVRSRNGEGFDMHFGPRGLSNAQKREFKNSGRFNGMRIHKGGATYEYMGPASRAGYIEARTLGGKRVELRDMNITELPTGVERNPVGPEIDALFRDFERFVDDKVTQVSHLGEGPLWDDALRERVANGTVKVDPTGRRPVGGSNTIIYPEEGGAGRSSVTLELVQGSIQEGAVWNVLDHNGNKLTHIVAGQFDDETLRIIKIGDNNWNEAAGTIGHGRMREALRQLVNQSREQGFDPKYLYGQRMTGVRAGTGDDSVVQMEVAKLMKGSGTPQQIAQEIAEEGADAGNILFHNRSATFEELFDAWAQARRIPKDATDYLAARSHFAEKMRDSWWKLLGPEEKAVLNTVREEQVALLNSGKVPLEAHAHAKGFHLTRLPDGSFSMRHIATGLRIQAGNAKTAQAALNNIIPQEGELVGSIFPLTDTGIAAFTGGLRGADQAVFLGGDVQLKAVMDDVPINIFQNLRDLLIRLEERTGLPLWSEIFDKMDTGVSRWRELVEPHAKGVQHLWRDLNIEERVQVAEFWRDIEGDAELTLDAAVALAKKAGLTERQIDAFRGSRRMFDEWFAISGIDGRRYVPQYFSRVRPWNMSNDAGGQNDFAKIFGGNVPPAFKWQAEMARTGDMPVVESDPLLVMHRYIRGMFYNQEVAPSFNRARNFLQMRVGDLEPALREKLEAAAGTALPDDRRILADGVHDLLSEYLNVVRGSPGSGLETLRSINRKLFKDLGIKGDDRALEEMLNIYISSTYGAAMAAKPSTVMRNMSQNLWMGYSRLGGRHAGTAMERAVSFEGYSAARNAGALRLNEAGVPYGDAIFEHVLENAPTGGDSLWGRAVSSGIRKYMRMGNVSRNFSEKLMVPFASSDQASRAWAFHWQRLHTEEWLTKWEANSVSWDKFLDEGLPFFAEPVRKQFADTLRYEGRERALDFIGKMFADETNFIYQAGTQPAWMQNAVGRLFGMFGTWPMWALEHYYRRIGLGSKKQQAAMIARTIGLVGAFGNIGVQTGIAMQSWVAPLSTMGWSGGPFVDHVVNLRDLVDAPVERKPQALRRLGRDLGRLVLPGQLFFNDFTHAARYMDDPATAGLIMALGRPKDEPYFNYSMDFIFNPALQEPVVTDPELDYRINHPMVDLGSRGWPESSGDTASTQTYIEREGGYKYDWSQLTGTEPDR